MAQEASVKELLKMKELYRKDSNFKRYVDRYCQSRVLTVSEALQHDLVAEVGRYYIMKHGNEKSWNWKNQFIQRFNSVI